ncbi:MAG TPA: ATPase [Clostridiales bacterium]|nr:ATPase [Clostridiales bacterium]
MKTTRIEQLIEDIYEFIESCRMQPLSTTKVIVPKDELYDLLDELRLRTPDEVKRYQKIIANRDAILEDAHAKAEMILQEAKENARDIINDHDITQQAYFQANEMVMQASEKAEKIRTESENDSNQIVLGALSYSNDVLSNMEKNLSIAYETSRAQYEGFINVLKENLEIVTKNRSEIEQQLSPTPAPSIEELYEEQEETDSEIDDYNFDEDTFLNNID